MHRVLYAVWVAFIEYYMRSLKMWGEQNDFVTKWKLKHALGDALFPIALNEIVNVMTVSQLWSRLLYR